MCNTRLSWYTTRTCSRQGHSHKRCSRILIHKKSLKRMKIYTNLRDLKVPIVIETLIQTMYLRYSFILLCLIMRHSILLILTLIYIQFHEHMNTNNRFLMMLLTTDHLSVFSILWILNWFRKWTYCMLLEKKTWMFLRFLIFEL